MKYTYMLQLQLGVLGATQEEEISRILDSMTSGFPYKDVYMDINANVTSKTARTMLHMLAISGMPHVACCTECCKLVVSDNLHDTTCAYDTVGYGDSHHVMRIVIREEQCRMPDCSHLIKFITTNEDWDISREVTPDSCQITFFLHGTRSIRNSVISHMQSLGGFAGVSFTEDGLSILVRVSQLKFEGDL